MRIRGILAVAWIACTPTALGAQAAPATAGGDRVAVNGVPLSPDAIRALEVGYRVRIAPGR